MVLGRDHHTGKVPFSPQQIREHMTSLIIWIFITGSAHKQSDHFSTSIFSGSESLSPIHLYQYFARKPCLFSFISLFTQSFMSGWTYMFIYTLGYSSRLLILLWKLFKFGHQDYSSRFFPKSLWHDSILIFSATSFLVFLSIYLKN